MDDLTKPAPATAPAVSETAAPAPQSEPAPAPAPAIAPEISTAPIPATPEEIRVRLEGEIERQSQTILELRDQLATANEKIAEQAAQLESQGKILKSW